MNFLGVDVNVKNTPELDKGFIPLGGFIDAYLKGAEKPVSFAVVNSNGEASVYDTFIHGTEKMRGADRYYAERLVKLLLWARGGGEVVVCGDEDIAGHIGREYSRGGTRAFDADFMSNVFQRDFTVRYAPLSEKPAAAVSSVSTGCGFDGCRIGFDAGGSDRKVSAVIDGEAVYSEEVVWNPKTNENPDYHYAGIVEAFKTAASKMPRVDAIGVSSAGIYINNRTMVASLFIKVPPALFDEKVRDIYINAAKEIGDVPLVVANDGDVAALAGALELGEGRVLGIAMGTSEAAGYVDAGKNITGYLNELAFAPVDCNPGAASDEWSGDIGCGVKYFSQDAVSRLAESAGIKLDPALTPAQKLKSVQELLDKGDTRAAAVYRSIGVYLGHALPLYAKFYDIGSVLLLGRVMSGEGGNIILGTAAGVMKDEYPQYEGRIRLILPDESSRRVGQSVAAAGLPKRAE